jgi:putative glutamine amidotransferase
MQDDEETLQLIYDRLDGVFLKGGVDVDPVHYKEERHPLCGRVDAARDWAEFRLTQWAVRDKKPLLGVCRGVQVINVALGGSLYQHLPEQFTSTIVHESVGDTEGTSQSDTSMHDVKIQPNTQLQRILGDQPLTVNSMHHQGIKILAPTLIATAFAPDGLVEGVEGNDGSFLVGVQWHPEELCAGRLEMNRLFTEFVWAAAGFQKIRWRARNSPSATGQRHP